MGTQTLAERLAKRFEDEICRVCVHRTSDGGCTLTEKHDCPVFEWAQKLAHMCDGMDSDRVGDYITEIQGAICPDCRQENNGSCDEREHLDCPLDVYASMVIRILEEELAVAKKRGR